MCLTQYVDPIPGLLAGLYEFPTSTDVEINISPTVQKKVSLEMLSSILQDGAVLGLKFPKENKQNGDVSESDSVSVARIEPAGDVIHVFSHIKKTYRAQWVVLVGGTNPPQLVENNSVVAPVKKKARRGASDGKTQSTEPSQTGRNQDAAMWVPLDEVMETK